MNEPLLSTIIISIVVDGNLLLMGCVVNGSCCVVLC